MRRLSTIAAALWLTLLVAGVGVLGTAWLAGWELDVVDTGSMAPEMEAGTLAVVAPARPAAVEIGDVVTFTDPEDGQGLVMHRVVEVVSDEDGPVLRTQGDANATPDPQLIPARSIEGRVEHSVPRLGALVRSLQPPVGPVLLVGVPTLLLGVAEVRRFRSRDARAAGNPGATLAT